jgi:hypothetical protein
MGTLSGFTFGDDQTVTMTTDMTEAHFCEGVLGVSGASMLAAFLPKCTVLSSLNFVSSDIKVCVLASIIRTLKKHAIEQQQACACLVGSESMARDLRALLVATSNLRRTLPALSTEQMCQNIAMWL